MLRLALPDGIAGVVFGPLKSVVVSRELRATETMRTLQRAIAMDGVTFAVIWIREIMEAAS